MNDGPTAIAHDHAHAGGDAGQGHDAVRSFSLMPMSALARVGLAAAILAALWLMILGAIG